MSYLTENLEAMFGKMEGFVSTKTVVGEPVTINGIIIIPLVDVSFGLGVGGGGTGISDSFKKEEPERKAKSGFEFSGSGGGMGAKITPSAVLVVINDTVQLVNVKNQESVNKLIDMVPGILSKLNLSEFFRKKETDKEKDI
jgi:uncharacterized spore protein YtfJ